MWTPLLILVALLAHVHVSHTAQQASGSLLRAGGLDVDASGAAHDGEEGGHRPTSRELQGVNFLPNTFISQFWGSGQAFSYTGRLSDWSWAGYRMNEKQIPSPPATWDVAANFGAFPNDDKSDWEAFNRALKTVPAGGVLYIPGGQYIIDKPLTITKSIIIRGAGRDVTTLYFPYSWTDIRDSISNPSAFTDGPFFISFKGSTGLGQNTRLGYVKAYSARGSTKVRLNANAATNFFVGQSLRFVGSDKDGNLVTYLYGNLTEKDWPDHLSSRSIINRKDMLQFMSRLKSFKRNGPNDVTLELERPLPFELRPGKWRDLAIYNDWRMSETGIEDLTIQFAASTYAGHHLERGYNALSFYGCQHSWARRLRIANVDVGLAVATSAYFTVEDIIFSETTDRSGGIKNRWDGHHGLRFAQTSDSVARNIQFQTSYIHDMTFDHTSVLNVWYDIRAPNLVMDFHSTCSAANLVSRVNCGACTRLWLAGGDVNAGGHAGMMNVFWGLVGWDGVTFMPMERGWGAKTTIIGAMFKYAPYYNDVYFEPVNPSMLLPWDLQASMFAWRQLGMNSEAIDAAQKQIANSQPNSVTVVTTAASEDDAQDDSPSPAESPPPPAAKAAPPPPTLGLSPSGNNPPTFPMFPPVPDGNR